jgi:hypothetical protein
MPGREADVAQTMLAVAADNYNVHHLTEEMLDVWWASLFPQEKAAVYEADTDGIHVLSQSRMHPEHNLLRAHAAQFLADMKDQPAAHL